MNNKRRKNSFYIIEYNQLIYLFIVIEHPGMTYHVVVVGVRWLAVASKRANSVAI